MPFLIPVLAVAAIGGTWWFGSSAGTAAGTAAGKGLGDAATIIGIAAGVGIIIYAVHKSGKRA
jgi:hypothetical protein